MEKISWTDRVRNEVLHRVKEKSMLRTVKKTEGKLDCQHLAQELPSKPRFEGEVEGKMTVMGR
jgi:hypothetical protein